MPTCKRCWTTSCRSGRRPMPPAPRPTRWVSEAGVGGRATTVVATVTANQTKWQLLVQSLSDCIPRGGCLRASHYDAPASLSKTSPELDGYLAIERRRPACGDPQHIWNKMLFDAANEALAAHYAQVGSVGSNRLNSTQQASVGSAWWACSGIHLQTCLRPGPRRQCARWLAGWPPEWPCWTLQCWTGTSRSACCAGPRGVVAAEQQGAWRLQAAAAAWGSSAQCWLKTLQR